MGAQHRLMESLDEAWILQHRLPVSHYSLSHDLKRLIMGLHHQSESDRLRVWLEMKLHCQLRLKHR
jgi:hypothetical protein